MTSTDDPTRISNPTEMNQLEFNRSKHLAEIQEEAQEIVRQVFQSAEG